MTDKEHFTAIVIAGICANAKIAHEMRYSTNGLAKEVVKTAREIVNEYYHPSD